MVAVGLLFAGALSAEEPAAKPVASNSEALIDLLNEVGERVIAMAEDFPEHMYDYKPAPEVRSFAEQLLHIAGGNYLFLDVAHGAKPGPEDLPREKYKTKAEIVAVLKKSFADAAGHLRENGDEGLKEPITSPWSGRKMNAIFWWAYASEHVGEHYGQLVVYYRNNGMVPPASRGN
jgi:uncharacterized damage-inducible protein DinB